MTRVPRVAVGTLQCDAGGSVMVWALLDALERLGLRVQTFLSQACFAPIDGATTITGLFPRHLDSWLMSPEVCRDIFLRAGAASDIAVVEGRFGTVVSAAEPSGGNLEALCEWLDLPRLAVIDVAQLADCRLPIRPSRLDGILLDRTSSPTQLSRLQTLFESLWGVPVLGSLPELPELREELSRLSVGSQPDRAALRTLGDRFAEHSQTARICRLASQRDFAYRLPAAASGSPITSPLHVAVAYDDAFHCYFPDTLDLLELKGAKVSDFSPLRDERLPAGTDIVYMGCGHPERYAAQLAGNDCLTAALRDHVRNGGRIYAEGGGLAYLCQNILTLAGEALPMAGVLPALARMNPDRSPPRAVEISLAMPSWLGPAGSHLRGYLNCSWLLEPCGPLDRVGSSDEGQYYLCAHRRAIGSRLHLNFAAQPRVLDRFFGHESPDFDLAAASSV